MAKGTGMQIDAGGNLLIKPRTDSSGLILGGLVIGNTLYQNQYLILTAQKGDIKEHPLLGAGIEDMANDNDTAEWRKRIVDELAKDGMKTDRVTITGGSLTIDAKY